MLEIVLNRNYFKYKNAIINEIPGYMMRSLSSLPILADIFTNDFYKNKIKTVNMFKIQVIVWKRYVNDILIIWNNNGNRNNETCNN